MAGLQMSWEPRHHKRKNHRPPLGLKNLGNSCYINSVLQCLTFTPPLANFCLRFQHSIHCDSLGDHCTLCLLEKRIVRSLNVDFVTDAPSKIVKALNLFAESFLPGRQEDAHEFLRYVIDKCDSVCLRIKKLQEERGGRGGGEGENVVKEIFGGVRCTLCGARSNKDDDMMDVSLGIAGNNSVMDAMQKFFQAEDLDGGNKYGCEKCKKLVKAKKQLYILQAPNVLVLHLKRFVGGQEKTDKDIAFQEFMVLSSFMSKASQDPCPEYSLCGTIVHVGKSANSGHYYAYIKDTVGKWYCCNDSDVTISTLQKVLSEKVYILFFTRSNRKPVPSHTPTVPKEAKPHASNGDGAIGVSSHHRNGSLMNGVISHNATGINTNRHVSIRLVEPLRENAFHEPSLRKALSMTKIEKGSASLQAKFSTLTNSLAKRDSLSGNGELHENKTQSVEKNRNPTHSKYEDKSKKNVALLVNGDDSAKNGTRNYQRNGCLAAGDVNEVVLHSAMPDVPDGSLKEECPTKMEALTGSRNSGETNSDKMLAESEHASVVLRKNGWADEVYEHMRSTKRLHVDDHALPLNNEFKRLLIADAKKNFIPKIPQSLKEDLVEQLETFLQANQPRKRKGNSAVKWHVQLRSSTAAELNFSFIGITNLINGLTTSLARFRLMRFGYQLANAMSTIM
ncbi:Ubiquitin carboxyl-terminal hydrolase 25-like protein [Drosera capensis]